MTLQEKIVSMAMWKGMSQRYFPANQLLNQANAVELQKMGTQMFNFTEMGAMPMGGFNVQHASGHPYPAPNDGPIKVQLADGSVVEGTLHTEKPEDKLSTLTDAIYALKDEVSKLRSHSTQQHRRIQTLEARKDTHPAE